MGTSKYLAEPLRGVTLDPLLSSMSLRLNILVAEDYEDDVFLLRQAFNKAGVTSALHVVPDGAEAWAYLKGEGGYADRKAYPLPDILLLDLNMPRMNGFELLERLRKDPVCGRLIVHVLTASIRAEDVERVYGLRANGYLVKPSRVDELVVLVRALHDWHRFISLPPPPSAKSAA